MNRLVMFSCIILACTTTVWADIYEWTDSRGVVHFTDDQKKVPAMYRSKLKIQPADENQASPPAATSPRPAEPAYSEKKPFGGHTREWWRSQFQTVQAELKVAQDKLVATKEEQVALHRKRVIFKRSSDRVAYNKLSDDIAAIEDQIKALQVKLTDLQKAADEVAVPSDWRQ